MSEIDSLQSPVFLTTRWSVVLAVRCGGSQESMVALETLCRTYWYPLYAYIRRAGHTPHDAQDLTQEFFARLLEKEWLSAADRERGKFRTFLLVAMKRFLTKERERAVAQKRGGGIVSVPLDPGDAELRYASEPALGADEVFERRWAITLLDQAVEQLFGEFQAIGKASEFEVLKDWLTAGRGEIPYENLATQLGMSEGATRVAVHRLRKRFRELFRQSIAQTVAEPEAIDGEIRHLAKVLGRVA